MVRLRRHSLYLRMPRQSSSRKWPHWKLSAFRNVVSVTLPVVAAFIVRLIFGVSDWSTFYTVMSLTFLVLCPYLIGVIAIHYSTGDHYKKIWYSVMFPWIHIIIFFIATILLQVEGLACWVMIFPIFLVPASLGGLTARYFRLRKSKRAGNLHLSLAVLLPFLMAPVEQMIGSIPGFYKAYTYIDISAPAETIWDHVTRVGEIQPSEDHSGLTKLLRLPRPIKAELNYNGAGAEREAIFAGGLIFNERVLQYEDRELMTFSIKANTHDIPSTTLDDHILIGGDYFDVLKGSYKLEQLDKNQFRLHLYSEFKLSTTFNFYASIWARWIMKDIQHNILQIIKQRSETKD